VLDRSVWSVFSARLSAIGDVFRVRSGSLDEYVNLSSTYARHAAEF